MKLTKEQKADNLKRAFLDECGKNNPSQMTVGSAAKFIRDAYLKGYEAGKRAGTGGKA